jgi:hypothetical protein
MESTAPPALAVRIAVCGALTAEKLAAKLAEVDPVPTVTEAGTLTAGLLLPRLTTDPPLGAAVLSVTVQSSVPAPVIDESSQLSPLNTGVLATAWLAAFSCTAKESTTPPALAVSIVVCAALTAEKLAAKLAEVDPAPTITVAGTVTAELLSARLTAKPPLAAAELSATVQLSVPAPVTAPYTQLNELNWGAFAAAAAVPSPLSPTTTVPLVGASLEIVSAPVVVPIVAGVKFTLTLNVLPAATVMGRLLAPLTENDCPARLTCDTFTAADP